MTHTWCVFTVILPWFPIAYRLTHCTQIPNKNHKCKWKPSVYMWGNSSHVLFAPKTLCISVEKKFSLQKPFVYTVHTAFEFTAKMGEALIDLVHQYPTLWDKQDVMHKDSNYKEAKWKEITEILCLTKEDVMKKWKSLRDIFVRHKKIKSKSGDGLSQCKPKWKYYDIMSFIDITLHKQRYVPIYLTLYIQHTYIQ